MSKNVLYKDLGQISYKEALDYQMQLHRDLVKRKLGIRDGLLNANDSHLIHSLLFCEHNSVYTLGKSGSISNLLMNEDELKNEGVEFYKTNRGGDITYHGPGQLVGYPILDLDDFFHDVHKYVRLIEEVIIKALQEFKINTTRIDGLTGVWIKGEKGASDRKICAIGIHMSRWITLHGFALNVNTQLDHFKGIIPCGIEDKGKQVTSMEQELNAKVDFGKVKEIVKKKFEEGFGFEYI